MAEEDAVDVGLRPLDADVGGFGPRLRIRLRPLLERRADGGLAVADRAEDPGIEQAREAVRVARLGYAAGRFSLLDVLDAEAALNTALTSIVEARRDRARALAALERAQAQ